MTARALVALVVCLTMGCYNYRATPVPSSAQASTFRATKVRVTLRDGRRIQMEHAYVRGDSLRTDDPIGATPAAVALADVDYLQVGVFSRSKTFWRSALVTEVALLGALLYIVGSDKS